MSNKKAISNLLLSVNKMVMKLTEEEIKTLESGKFELVLNHTKIKNQKDEKTPSSQLDKSVLKKINTELDLAKSREDGLDILEFYLKTKKELEMFAKNIDVVVMKSDKVDKIKNNIVDATVGARLRSGAIQGKEI